MDLCVSRLVLCVMYTSERRNPFFDLEERQLTSGIQNTNLREWTSDRRRKRGTGSKFRRRQTVFATGGTKMKIDEVLRQKGNRIVSVRIDSTVEEAARVLRKENVGAVIVKDVCRSEGDTVVGMFSERDVIRALVDQGVAGLRKPVWNLMSKSVISCSPQDEVEYALELMDRHHIRHLPVFENNSLIGVVSIRDLSSVASRMGAQPPQVYQFSGHPPAH